jgi:membrane protease YdiL (CAAX protease family)
MLTPKPWKLESMIRLLFSVVICVSAGSVLAALVLHDGHAIKLDWKLGMITGGSFGFMIAALVLIRGPWQVERMQVRLIVLLICFYAAFILGAWAVKITGRPEVGPSTGQMIIASLSFQGAALVLVALLLKDHHIAWRAAFGFANNWPLALVLGLLAACVFFLIGRPLEQVSYNIIERLPAGWHLNPEEQLPVQTLRTASGWLEHLVLGVVTIVLAPAAEEVLFRGILYPWIKQAGFPRLALWGTSLVFAAIHLNAMAFLPLLVLALLLTALYERTDNLFAPIATHSFFNAINFTGIFIQSDKALRIEFVTLAVLITLLLVLFWILERKARKPAI